MIADPLRILLLGLLVAVIPKAASEHQLLDFSGTWVLNLTKSSLGKVSVTSRPTALKVDDQGSRLITVEIVERGNGKSVVQRDILLNPSFMDGSVDVMTRRSRNTIKIALTLDGRAILEVWSLSHNGSQLLITRNDGPSIQRLFFTRATSRPLELPPG